MPFKVPKNKAEPQKTGNIKKTPLCGISQIRANKICPAMCANAAMIEKLTAPKWRRGRFLNAPKASALKMPPVSDKKNAGAKK